MKNKRLIAAGLAVFFIIVLSPWWWNLVAGGATAAPQPELTVRAKEAKYCVEPAAYMKTEHMRLLEGWRQEVVRNSRRTYVSSQGRSFDMSLTSTCLDCHSNKAKFCDACHNYASVRPYCWGCHNTKENK